MRFLGNDFQWGAGAKSLYFILSGVFSKILLAPHASLRNSSHARKKRIFFQILVIYGNLCHPPGKIASYLGLRAF